MHHRRFLALLDEPSVLAAIRLAEQKTSGQIRVFVSHHKIPEPMAAARRQFRRLGMAKTKGRNAVLIFMAPKSKNFAILGDVAMDAKCGAEFWEKLRDEIIPHLKTGQYSAAMVHAISKVGERLAEYFPPKGDAGNELPDAIAGD